MAGALARPGGPAAAPAFPVDRVRADFPVLSTRARGRPLVYLDSANTSQKPRCVIDAEREVYETFYANVHRGVYEISERAERAFEATRGKARAFLNARETREVVFVRGATEAINLVAYSWGRANVRAGDEVLVSALEHHSNLVPWQILCEEKDARLRVIPIDDRGEIVLEEAERLLGPRTRLLAVAHVSNALGTVNPVKALVDLAHGRGVRVLVDGAQAAPHLSVDVQALDCDFYAVSGHKMFGPSGIGLLYGRASLLEGMPPFQGGGSMISSVTFAKTTYAPIPQKFEAGTPNIAGTIAYGAAFDYLQALGMDRVAAYEADLQEYARAALAAVPGLRLVGTPALRAGVFSFTLEGIHPHDAGTVLDHEGIAVRTGHHCAQPVMDRYGVPATVRASFALYNTREDVDALVRGLGRVREMLG
jgi:cysteine desulfurase/selenocysteine lyase